MSAPGPDILPLTAAEAEALGERLEDFNAAATGLPRGEALAIGQRDEAGRVVAGLAGVTTYSWLYIAVLWVDEALRGQGLAARLLAAAEDEARSRGCRDACLTSFSFQAPGLYLGAGYEVFGQLDDYPPGATMYFLRKHLDDGYSAGNSPAKRPR